MTLPSPLKSFVLAPLAVAASLATGCAPPPPRATVHEGRIAAQQTIRSPVYSIDAKTGVSVSMPAGGWADEPAAKGGVVYVHGAGGLAARELATGEVKWRVLLRTSYLWDVVPTKRVVFAPHVVHADLLGGTETGWVALDAEKGTRIYEVRADRFAPLAANDDVVATIENGELVGYAVVDGKERWRSTIPAEGPLFMESGRLFARSEDKLAVFSTATGTLVKRIDLGGTGAFRALRPQIAARGDVVVWVDSDVVHAADVTSGKQLWKRDGADDLALAGDIVVASTNYRIEGLDLATGAVKWTTALDHRSASISASGDTIVARLDREHVAVLDAATGKQRFAFDLQRGAPTKP